MNKWIVHGADGRQLTLLEADDCRVMINGTLVFTRRIDDRDVIVFATQKWFGVELHGMFDVKLQEELERTIERVRAERERSHRLLTELQRSQGT